MDLVVSIEDIVSVVLAMLQAMIVGYITYLEAKKKSPAVFMWATLFLMFGVMHLFAVVFGITAYPLEVLDDASVFVILFAVCYLSIRYKILKKEDKTNFDICDFDVVEKSNKGAERYIIFWTLFVFLGLGLYVQSVGSIWDTSWSIGREVNASLQYFNINQVCNLIFFTFSGIGLYCLCTGRKKQLIWVLFVILLEVFISRNRITILPLFSIVITYVLTKIKRIKVLHCVYAFLGAIFIIYVVYGLRVFRHYGSISVAFDLFEWDYFIIRIHEFIETGNGELGLRNWFYYFIDHDNEFQGFGTCASYVRMLLVFIPTKFCFGLKPDDFAITMGTAIGMAEGGSMHPTLFGDCYANAGWFGVLLGGFWALYVSLFDKIVESFSDGRYKAMIYVLLASMYAIIGRGSVYNAFVFVAWGSFFLFLFEKISVVKLSTKRISVSNNNC